MITNVYEDIMPWLNDVARACQTDYNFKYRYTKNLDIIIKGPAFFFEIDDERWVISKDAFNKSLAKHKKNNPFLYLIFNLLDWECTSEDNTNLENFLISII